MRFGAFTAATAAVALVAFSAHGTHAQQQLQFLSPGAGTNVFTAASAISSVIRSKTKLSVTVSTSVGPQVQVPQINDGKGDFTILNGADAYQAVHGIEPYYRKKQPNLRMMAVGYSNSLGMITRADSGIVTAADLKGKRVTGLFSAHKACYDLSSMLLANLGLTWNDVKVVPVPHSRDSAPALAQGRVDVALCIPVGQAVLKEVNARTPIRFISLDPSPEALVRARKFYPSGSVEKVAKGTSDGVVADTFVWKYPFYLVTSTHASDDDVYTITKAIYEHLGELRTINNIFQSWPKEGMADADVTIPYHNGAIRFFKEAGLWTGKMDESQSTLLAHIND